MKLILKIVAGLFLFMVLVVVSGLVTMNLAVKKGEVLVPALKGKELSTAINELGKVGLTLKIEEQRAGAREPRGTIIAQEPDPGAKSKKYRQVKVVISTGQKGSDAPNLIGKTLVAAEQELGAFGLASGNIIRVHGDAPAPGQVIAQYPAPGVALDPGAKVNLLVSLGRAGESYLMPNLLGMTLQDATRVVKELNMQIGRISYEPYEGVPAMTIIKQTPRSGYKVESGEKVSLVMSRGDSGKTPGSE